MVAVTAFYFSAISQHHLIHLREVKLNATSPNYRLHNEAKKRNRGGPFESTSGNTGIFHNRNQCRSSMQQEMSILPGIRRLLQKTWPIWSDETSFI
ncbi:MAG: hypothetical protein NZ961_12755, partial [Candidatus Poribacteria bacterium]|nr:hypothetical protein [Candidatus Poribacteria bacterium]